MLLSLATVVAMYHKNKATVPAVAQKAQVSAPPSFATKAELDEAMAKVNDRLDKSTTRMDLWSHRIWLLAVANNENVALRKKQEAQYPGVVENRYIFFDENWKINRFPDSMELTEKQKQDLQRDTK